MTDYLDGALDALLGWLPAGLGELAAMVGIVLVIVGVVTLAGKRRARAIGFLVAGATLVAPAVVLKVAVPLVGVVFDLILGAGQTAGETIG